MKLSEIAGIVGGRLLGDDVEITGAGDLSHAGPGEISFVQARKHEDRMRASRAGAFLVSEGIDPGGRPAIFVRNPKFAFVRLLSILFPPEGPAPGIHPTAVLGDRVRLGEGVSIGPAAIVEDDSDIGRHSVIGAGAFVGKGTRIGADARLYPNVVVHHSCVLGDRVVIHAGSVIGADGFGYIQEERPGEADDRAAIERYRQYEGPHVRVPQLGNVVIENDVEIGALTAIDRATVGSTVIGEGTKVDNLVMIGHNCRIGKHSIVVANVGLSGSVAIGEHVTLAGKVGISEGVEIGEYSVVGAASVIFAGKKYPPGSTLLGYPARDGEKALAQMGGISALPRLRDRVAELEKKVKALEAAARRGGEGSAEDARGRRGSEDSGEGARGRAG